MKHLKKFENYSNLMESLNVLHDDLLSSINGEEVDIFDTFKLPQDEFKDKLDIDFLSDNITFINSLASIALKKSPIQLTDDYECFINKTCKFMFIYDVNSNELENPEYLLFQVWNETLNKWEDCKLYKVNDDVKKFYDKLSSKTIEIMDGENKYIYTTSNGNDWELQNLDNKNKKYKRFLTKQQLFDLLETKVKFNVV